MDDQHDPTGPRPFGILDEACHALTRKGRVSLALARNRSDLATVGLLSFSYRRGKTWQSMDELKAAALAFFNQRRAYLSQEEYIGILHMLEQANSYKHISYIRSLAQDVERRRSQL